MNLGYWSWIFKILNEVYDHFLLQFWILNFIILFFQEENDWENLVQWICSFIATKINVTKIVKYEICSFLNHHAPFVLPLGNKKALIFNFELYSQLQLVHLRWRNRYQQILKPMTSTIRTIIERYSENSPFCETSCLVMQLCWRYSRAQELSCH